MQGSQFLLLLFYIQWRCKTSDLNTERSLTRENGDIFHVRTEQWAQRSDPSGNPKVPDSGFLYPELNRR